MSTSLKKADSYYNKVYHTNSHSRNYRSPYEKQRRLTPEIGKYINNVTSGKFSSKPEEKQKRAFKLLEHLANMRLVRKVDPAFLRAVAKNANYNSEFLRVITNRYKRIRSAPAFFRRGYYAAPKMKLPNVNLKNVSDYMNLKRKILKATNVPGTYQMRKNLLAKLNRQLNNLNRENFISLNTIKPSKNMHYVLKNGHPGTWLYLTPNSYHSLALKIGRRGIFTHPTTRRVMYFGNFKLVKR